MLRSPDLPSRQELLNELDSYRDTVSFLIALIHELSWDAATKRLLPGLKHEHGAEQKYAQGAVTPDLALLLAPEWGVLGEAKTGFAKSVEGRAKIREQLLKYDAVAGTWTGADKTPARVKAASTVMLTHLTRRIDAGDYFDAEKAAGRFDMKLPFAIVGAARLQQGQEFIHLERSYGTLVPKEKDEKLRKGVPIRLDHIRTEYAGIRFYDSTPPLPLLLQVIWDELLPSMVPEDNYGEARKGAPKDDADDNALQITLRAKDTARDLRDRFSMRLLNRGLRESPRRSVVEGALQTLVEWGLAKRLDDESFVVSYKRLNRGTLEFILRKLAPEEKPPKKRKDKRQIPLFSDDSGSVDREPE
jgi:hypothetical protein